MKRFFALLLTGSVAVSMAAPAFATDKAAFESSNVEGDGTVQAPTISYQIPTDLDFAVNTFQKGDTTGSQIYSATFNVINKCDVPIQVSVKASVGAGTSGAAVNIKESADKVNFSDSGVTTKDVYMEMVSASTFTIGTTGTYPTFNVNDGEATTFGADSAAKAALPKTTGTPSTENAGLIFALKEAAYGTAGNAATATPDAAKGAAAFRFMGAANPYAAWADNDLQVKGVFDVIGISTKLYDKTIADADANVKGASPTAVAVIGESAQPKGVSYSYNPGVALSFKINKGTDAAKYTAIKSITCDALDGADLNNERYMTFSWGGSQIITMTATDIVTRSSSAGTKFTFVFTQADGTDSAPVVVTLA